LVDTPIYNDGKEKVVVHVYTIGYLSYPSSNRVGEFEDSMGVEADIHDDGKVDQIVKLVWKERGQPYDDGQHAPRQVLKGAGENNIEHLCAAVEDEPSTDTACGHGIDTKRIIERKKSIDHEGDTLDGWWHKGHAAYDPNDPAAKDSDGTIYVQDVAKVIFAANDQWPKDIELFLYTDRPCVYSMAKTTTIEHKGYVGANEEE
jgi:hypothetical protein